MEKITFYAPDELQPSTAIHPGEILKDELEARKLSQKKFAGIISKRFIEIFFHTVAVIIAAP